MLILLVVCGVLATLPAAPPSAPGSRHGDPSARSAPARGRQDGEFERRRKEARGDLAALWKVVDWCEARGETRERDLCLKDILKLDETDEKAHQLLGHLSADGQWFTSEKKLEAYRKKKEREVAKEARARGLVLYEDRWIEPADLPFLERGLVRDEEGRWITLEELARLEAGWHRQDLTWIPPEEVPLLERDLWKCGEEWLTLDEADLYHDAAEQPWVIPGQHFVLRTTVSRTLALKALTQADFAHEGLVRVFGVAPAVVPTLLVLNSQDQYRTFSKGDRDGGDVGKSAFGMSSLHGAYFADNWFDDDGEFLGAGVTYWEAEDATANSFGPLWVRHAAGQSFIAEIDPSPEALQAATEKGSRGFEFAGAFWEEKLLPSWLRYGACAYVERYAPDRFVGPDGDPLWARKWSIKNLESKGGVDSLGEIMSFRLSPDDSEKAGKLINESGLVVAFILDGECKSVVKEHGKLIEAFIEVSADREDGRKGLEKAIERLEKALEKNEKKLRAFAKP